VVHPSTVGAFAVSIVPIDSNCRPPGEIFINVCLAARSGDMEGGVGAVSYDGHVFLPLQGVVNVYPEVPQVCYCPYCTTPPYWVVVSGLHVRAPYYIRVGALSCEHH
jgi:hypothetical protein